MELVGLSAARAMIGRTASIFATFFAELIPRTQEDRFHDVVRFKTPTSAELRIRRGYLYL